MEPSAFGAALKARAGELGFDLCGIAPAAGLPELRFLSEWLARGYAGTMAYMARSAERRADVRRIMPSARSVIVTGTLYNIDRPYSIERATDGEAVVSRYAWGDDYHDVLLRRLEALIAWMREERGDAFEARAYVDTGPVQERAYAHAAGLGWVGKNTCLISPAAGSWFFLGEIICNLALEPDVPEPDHCGTCTLCLEACPTGALREPRVLDATRCISYLTIELKTGVPEPLRDGIGRHIHGCDICQDVCPYNLDAPRSRAPEWLPRGALDGPGLASLWRRPDAELAAIVSGTPMTRPRLVGLRRNLAIAMGNSGDPETYRALADPLSAGGPLASPTSDDPVVREHLEWARRKRNIQPQPS